MHGEGSVEPYEIGETEGQLILRTRLPLAQSDSAKRDYKRAPPRDCKNVTWESEFGLPAERSNAAHSHNE